MFCRFCGSQIGDDVRFCPKCGNSLSASKPNKTGSPAYSNSTNEATKGSLKTKRVKAPKKKMSGGIKTLIIILIVVVVLGAAGGFVYFKIFNSPNNQIIRAMEDGSYEAAVMLYEENFYGVEDGDMVKAMGERLEELERGFHDSTVEYSVAKMELSTIADMRMTSLDRQIEETEAYIESLNKSMTAFKTAEGFIAAGDYANAIKQYQFVVEEDPNYEAAKTQMEQAITKYKGEVLANASAFAASELYSQATTEIRAGLQTLPNDQELTRQLTIYSEAEVSMKKAETLSAAREYADGGNYEDAISIIGSALSDDDSDVELNVAYDEYCEAYVDEAISLADEFLKQKDFSGALREIQTGLGLLSENKKLQVKYDEIQAKSPVSVRALTPLNSDYDWNDAALGNEDALGYTYENLINCFTPSFRAYGEYYIKGDYSRVTGTLSSYYGMPDKCECNFQIRAEDKIIYTSPIITQKTNAFDFDVEIPDGTNYITFEYLKDNINYSHNIMVMNLLLWPDP